MRRIVRWKNEWSYLAHVPRALTTFRGILKISSAGTLTGLQAPEGSRVVELKPYALGGVTTDTTARPAVSGEGDGRIGGDLKYGLTQNLTADLTVNTDFAQVEVDEQQVNLTRFNLFFPEKRDFFLEGAGTFAFAGRASAGLAAGSGDTPYLFFSRRIGLHQGLVVPVRAGGRLTGRVGRTTLGLLNMQTGDVIEPAILSLALNTARLEITPRLSVEPGLSANWVDLPQGSFTATVFRSRVTFTVTPRMFVSGIAQYNSTGTSVGSNVRFRWEYAPGSELFVVYTDDYNTDAARGVDALRNRAMVVKINRLFRP